MKGMLNIAIAVMLMSPMASARSSEFSHDRFADVLEKHVNANGLVDYKALKADRKSLDEYVDSLGALNRESFESWSESQQIALLINAYNAFVLRVVIDHNPIKSGFFKSFKYPEGSIQHIDKVWSDRRFMLMGRKVSLDDIEHDMLRMDYREPRIHMAINCASIGCPPQRTEPFRADELDAQIDDQSRRFLSNREKFRIDRDAGVVYLSAIFKWFGEDFVGPYQPGSGFGRHGDALRAVLNFVAGHIEPSDADYLRGGSYRVKWLDYDWSLNDQSSGN